MRVPGDGSSGRVEGGIARGAGVGSGGGVIPRGDSVSEYGGADWSVMGGKGLRTSAGAERPPDELLPVPVPAE